jgi:glucose/arabinose dehydrogenase
LFSRRALWPIVATVAILAAAKTVCAEQPLSSTVFVSGLSQPVAFVQDPLDAPRQLVVEQGGHIRVVWNGVLQPTLFLDLSASISTGGERGLLGFAYAPDYGTSRRFFVNFTDPAGNTVIARFKCNPGDASTADPASRFDLRWGGPTGQRFITQPYTNHNGGNILFGPDGFLYIGMGDGGSGGDPENRAQDPTTLLGKMLRIDVNVPDSDPEGYVIPPTNPFAVGAGPVPALPEIWAFGLRNPWRFSFDPLNSAMLIGDVGQAEWEEIDYQTPGRGGLNYGWRNYEGSHVYDNSVAPAYGPLTFPIIEYDHSVGRSITGGVICRAGLSCNYTAPDRYFYADFITGRVWSVHLTTDAAGNVTATDRLEHTAELSAGGLSVGNVSAFAIADQYNNLYMVLYDSGKIVRVHNGIGHPPRGPHYTRFDLSVPAVYRPGSGEWLISGVGTTVWGLRGDIPVWAIGAGIAVYRPSTGTWYIPDTPAVVWGAPGDIPVAGRYGPGFQSGIAVYRPSTGTWYVKDGPTVSWGLPGDIPVPADYGGNNMDDFAVYRPSNGTWYVRGRTPVQWGQPGDIPVPADYNGDGIADFAVFRPTTGQWLVRGMLTVVWGAAGDIPIPLNMDSDYRAELVVFRPATGTWHSLSPANGTIQAVQFGQAGDVPLGLVAPMPVRLGDSEGDRRADLTVFRPSTAEWISAKSSTDFTTFTRRGFGMSTDTPVARDYDGDGVMDPAVFRPSQGVWYALLSSTGFSSYSTSLWGATGDIAVPADYDGDGRADVAVFRPSLGRWFLLLSAGGSVTRDWGLNGDIPVPADYDGDGRADLAVFRPSTGRWFLLDRFTGAVTSRDWGLAADIPVPADYDGDRRADLAVYRPSDGRWHIFTSSTAGYTSADWGLSGDVPMPLDYDGDGRTDIAVYRPSTGDWYARGLFVKRWGLPGDVPVPKQP